MRTQMSGDNHSQQHKTDLDSLAQKIRLRIQENDVCIIDEKDLEFIWRAHPLEPHCDVHTHMHKHLDAFARHHGFEVHISSYARAVIFR